MSRDLSKPGSGRFSTFDNIMRYLKAGGDDSGVSLSEQDQSILMRWEAALASLEQHKPRISDREVAKMIQLNFDVSLAQAIRDVQMAKKVFGNLGKAHKDFQRVFYTAWLEKIAEKAIDKKNYDAAIRAIRTISKLNRLEHEDAPERNESPRTFELVLVFNGGTGEQGTKKRTINLQALDDIPEAEYEEIIKITDRPRLSVADMNDMLNEDESSN